MRGQMSQGVGLCVLRTSFPRGVQTLEKVHQQVVTMQFGRRMVYTLWVVSWWGCLV